MPCIIRCLTNPHVLFIRPKTLGTKVCVSFYPRETLYVHGIIRGMVLVDSVHCDYAPSRLITPCLCRPTADSRQLASSMVGAGMSAMDVPEWKKHISGGVKASYGRKEKKSLLEQRQSLPIYKLKNELLKVGPWA